MTLADNKATARYFFEVELGRGDWSHSGESIAEDVIMHHPSNPNDIWGCDAVRDFLTMFRAGFPDLKMTVKSVFGEDDMVSVRWQAQGAHTGELFGIPPTGKNMHINGISILRFKDGKIVEDWVSEDSLGLLTQLGVIGV